MESVSALQDFVDTTFDYIIIGGGTAGLPVANRLSENPQIKVGIIEAGLFLDNDSLIDIPGNLARNNGNPEYDWVSSTSPQSGADGRSLPVVRGKVLGGTTALNYMAWDRGSKQEYDAWKLVSEADGGWDWESLLPFFVKAENVEPSPTSVNRDLATEYSASEAHTFSPGIPPGSAVGVAGPVKLRYNTWNAGVTAPYTKAWNALNQQTNLNPYGGDTSGIYNCLLSVDPVSGKRTTAVSAYYKPVASRPNLKLLTGAQVTKILFKPDLVDGNRVAHGVEFTVDGNLHSVFASKEIVLSAGAIQTPQVLEISGIGSARLLESMGIQTLVDLPGVGENFHDHPFAHIHYQAKTGVFTLDELAKNTELAAAEQKRFEETGQGWMTANDNFIVFTALNKIVEEATLSSKIKEFEAAVAIQKSNVSANKLGVQQHLIQLDWLKQGRVPHLEFLMFSRGVVRPDPSENYFIFSTGLQHPLSRGSVHIQSADPSQQPLINPGYLTDLFSLLAGYRTLEKLAQTPPLADIIAKQVLPATPLSDEEVMQYIRQSYVSGGHYMGTAAMARRELGGVVNSKLKVHGTANLRVADASIIPMPVATHIQATVYAIGETAADLIKSEHKL
ncbi:alcohol oxidase [Mycena polygramma]|nr:alcohol oxidase [Mycena polygramma]